MIQQAPYYMNNYEFNFLKIKSISCGSYHSLVLSESGCVYSCGLNSSGQLDGYIEELPCVKCESETYH